MRALLVARRTWTRRPAAAVMLSCLVAAGCGGPRARIVEATERGDVEAALARYDELAAHDGGDLELLHVIALRLLSDAAASDDPDVRADAIRELSLAGVPALSTLERLSTAGGASATAALLALARRGHPGALRLLRGMVDDERPDVRAACTLALDPDADRTLLFALALEPSERVRAAATLRLGALGPSDVEARLLLEERARVDPDAGVRAAAVRALGSYASAAIASLRDRLSDPEPSVRLASIEALVRADRAGARNTIAAMLATPPAMESIEAARILASSVGLPDAPPSAEDRSSALAYLRQALLAPDPALRAQAAIALVGVPGRDDLAAPLEGALARETDESAAFSMARALLRRASAATSALERLRALATAEGGRLGLEAAVVLAEEGDETGIGVVRRVASDSAPERRRTAVRALAREARRPFEVRPALADSDLRVRVAAAGGIVAAYAAR